MDHTMDNDYDADDDRTQGNELTRFRRMQLKTLDQNNNNPSTPTSSIHPPTHTFERGCVCGHLQQNKSHLAT